MLDLESSVERRAGSTPATRTMEGTAKWLATRFEPWGMVKHGSSILLPSSTVKKNGVV
jgi:hypothetical protein